MKVALVALVVSLALPSFAGAQPASAPTPTVEQSAQPTPVASSSPSPVTASPAPSTSAAPATPFVENVVRETLANGMHVVVLPNSLAPVATTIVVYGVGSTDDTAPGIAHATEHMLFRGTPSLSAGQLSDLAARMGAVYNAFTSYEETAFYFKLPSAYVDIALRIEADRMTHASIAEDQWKDERPAIEDEVRGYQSKPFFTVGQKLRATFFKGTPFATAGAGTVASFDAMHADDIRAFYHRWYVPSNATLIVAGDFDAKKVLASIHRAFDPIPAAPAPVRSPLVVPPLEAATLEEQMDFPIGFSALMYRLPGADDPDYAASLVLAEALKSPRGTVLGLSADGKALASFALNDAFNELGLEYTIAIPPRGGTPASVRAALRAALDEYRDHGVPADLIADGKRKLLAESAYRSASISGLALAWAQTVGRRASFDDLRAALTAVGDDDVARVLHTWLDPAREVSVDVTAHPSSVAAKVDPNAGTENVAYTPTVHTPLPAWANALLATPLAPPDESRVVGRTLPNGIRLAVRREHTSPTIELTGVIRSDDQLYEPKGKDGVGYLLDALLPYGTTRYDRKAYQAQFDALPATAKVGRTFSLRVRSEDFERGVDLLAEGLLHPAFDAATFAIVHEQFVDAVTVSSKLPKSRAEAAERAALYAAGDPRRRSATPATLAAVTIGDVKSYYRFAFRPDETAIGIVGDVTPERARAAIVHAFGNWHASGKRPSFERPDVENTSSHGQTVVVKSASTQESEVTLKEIMPTLTRSDDDYVPLLLANTMLSGEELGSFLESELRGRRGFVYSIDSTFDVDADGGSFSVTYSTEPKNVARANATIAGIIHRLQTTPLPVADVQRAKARLIAGRVLPLDSYAGVASEMLENAKIGYYGDRSFFWKRLVAVTPAQIERAMRRIHPERFVRTIVEPQ